MGAASSGLALTKTFKQIEEWSFSKAMNLHKDYQERGGTGTPPT